MKTILIFFAVCLIAAVGSANIKSKEAENENEMATIEKFDALKEILADGEFLKRVKRQDDAPPAAGGAAKPADEKKKTESSGAGISKASTPAIILIAALISIFKF